MVENDIDLNTAATRRQESAPAAISPVAWQPGSELDLAEWTYQGKRLGSIGRGASWWIGDWVNYGNTRFGEKYLRAAEVTGYDVQSLMNMAYVAAKYASSRRREKLSWSHHAELAALPPDERDRWLDRAEFRRISVHGLREELRSWRAHARQVQGPAVDDDVEGARSGGETGQDESLRCPQCGYELAEHHQNADRRAPVHRHAEPTTR